MAPGPAPYLPVVVDVSVNVGIGDLTQDEDLRSGKKCTCLRSPGPVLAMAALHLTEAGYLCERTVMMKKANASEIRSPTSSPRKITEENVTIQTTL